MDFDNNDFGFDSPNDGLSDSFDSFGSEEYIPSAEPRPAGRSRFRRTSKRPEPISIDTDSAHTAAADNSSGGRYDDLVGRVHYGDELPKEPVFRDMTLDGARRNAPQEPAYEEAPQEPAYEEAPQEPAYEEAPQEPAYEGAPQEPAYEEAPQDTRPAALRLKEYVDCHFRLIGAGTDINEVNRTFLYALHYGMEWGYRTVMLPVSDSLANRLCLDGNGYPMTPDKVRGLRKSVMNNVGAIPEYEAILGNYRRKTAVMSDKGIDIGAFENADVKGPAINCFSSFVSKGVTSRDLLILQVPVDEPWQIFQWIPVGGTGSMPSNEDLMAVSRHWHELCGAVPAVIGNGVVEYYVPNGRPSRGAALEIARGQFAICHERVLRLTKSHTLSELVDTLTRSCVWYLSWK